MDTSQKLAVTVDVPHAYKITIADGKIGGKIIPIPLALWDAIIGFHRMVAVKHEGESVSYHRFHQASGRYHTIIPYQRTSKGGLSVHTDWKDKRNIELADKYASIYGEDFFPACTIHTHVDVAAFESGTDAKDEEDYPGWHITLGHLLTKTKYDFDFRIRLPKIKKIKEVTSVEDAYSLNWRNFFTKSATEERIHKTPGTKDWEHFLKRVV